MCGGFRVQRVPDAGHEEGQILDEIQALCRLQQEILGQAAVEDQRLAVAAVGALQLAGAGVEQVALGFGALQGVGQRAQDRVAQLHALMQLLAQGARKILAQQLVGQAQQLGVAVLAENQGQHDHQHRQ
jgi:hypothetical protein